MVEEKNSIEIFDRRALRRNRLRSADKITHHDFLIQWAEEQLLDRLHDIKRKLPLALQIGVRGSDTFKTRVKKISGARTFVKMELGRLRDDQDICGDEEYLPFADHSLDLVLSALSLHSINDLPGTLIQIRRALKPDGLFLAALLGGETLHELRESLMQTEISLKGGASPRIFPFADKQQIGALMQRAGFALPVIDSEIITATYDSMHKLMHDIRGMGEGNIIKARDKTNPGKTFFEKAEDYYKEHFTAQDGRLIASFEVIFIIGWAPHESQQKPLKPGSAQNRLADALQTDEIKTGEKAIP